MLKNLLSTKLYIKIWTNKFEGKNLAVEGEWRTVFPAAAFTTERLLVGNMNTAETALRNLINELCQGKLFKKSAEILIHPMEKIEGGISEVEYQVFRELALGGGAYKVAIHTGNELTNQQARDVLESL